MIAEFLRASLNACRIPIFRHQLWCSLLLVLGYRICAHLTVLPINEAVINNLVRSSTFMEYFYALFSAGAIDHFSLFSLGILPVFMAQSIIAPFFRLNDPIRQRRLERYVTFWVAFVLSLLLYRYIYLQVNDEETIAIMQKFSIKLYVIISMIAASMLLTWVCDKASEHTIIKPYDLLIISNLSYFLANCFIINGVHIIGGLVLIVVLYIFFLMSTLIMQAIRRIPIQTPKKVVGTKMYAGQNSVLPVSFINSSAFQQAITAYFFLILIIHEGLSLSFEPSRLTTLEATFLDIGNISTKSGFIFFSIFFAFFYFIYLRTLVNPVEIAENLRKSNHYIPGLRPGKMTADFLKSVISRLSVAGVLSVIAILFGGLAIGIQINRYVGLLSIFATEPVLAFILIHRTAGIISDGLASLESQLQTQIYEGFLKAGRLRGRRT